ncbi:MAG: BspA family leucine-rich repeat surface protein [Bacteroidaceae bacterium]|nr:BspA family leucine-rich repeat surface protein [Bacteroidaceae bacterium]
MKKILASYLLLCACAILQAMPIEPAAARQKALAFVQSRVSEDTEDSSLELAMRSEVCYVFNINQHDGFVIVGGDDLMPDILGYADTGTFNADSVPECLHGWLDGYAAQLECLRTLPEASPVSHKTVSKISVSPMLQRMAVDEALGALFTDSLASSGSMATALAEIVCYHQQVTSQSQVQASTITALRDSVLSANTPQDIIQTLVNDFGCYDDIHHVRRSFYSSEHWEQIIYRELRDKRPVVYGGLSQDSTTYAFVVDGYAPDNYFHINWELDGAYNGYFLLSILETYDGGQYVFAGIQPEIAYDIPQAYAILNVPSKALLFYYDCDINNHPELAFQKETYTIKSWRDIAESIQHFNFRGSFADYTLYTLDEWCKNCKSLQTLNFLENFNTTYATSMNNMFQNCTSLISLKELNLLNTENVTSMIHVFDGCSKLQTLDISKLNTAKVTYMNGMFYKCSQLTSLNISFANTEKVTTMANMFMGCTNLKELNMATVDTRSVTSMSRMFYGCEALDPNYFTTCRFNTHHVTNMKQMFYNCKTLFWIDMQDFRTENVTTMANMFYGCSDLQELNLKNFNTQNVENMQGMFGECTKLQTIYASDEWSNEKVTNSSNMFKNCTSLKGGKGTPYNALYLDASYARYDEGADTPGYFTYRPSVDVVAPESAAEDNDAWYTINGIKLHQAPTQKGLYIHQGKKVTQ